jgi:hypothetical protein
MHFLESGRSEFLRSSGEYRPFDMIAHQKAEIAVHSSVSITPILQTNLQGRLVPVHTI